MVEAILNTPELKVEQEVVFRKALKTYVEKNIKFADAVMGYWGLDKGYTTVFTYDEKDFRTDRGTGNPKTLRVSTRSDSRGGWSASK